MIDFEINGKPLKASQGSMIIEAADQAGIWIPRFCYHKKLSIAANCRMCLVEVANLPKPVPACATPITAGMKVDTLSAATRTSQKIVMEFLLINHPLDCPICDQGGECELQDIAMGFGRDASQYQETKRAVEHENIGSLIATEMTRCIQCTRCVRFGEEIAGVRELGGIGRGEHMQISTFVAQALTSEVSGNIIDLCPVGALTSKPFRFAARAWELRQTASISPHDCLGTNIYLHSRNGDDVLRVVPKENEAINETWISDRDRFSYPALQSNSRVLTPMLKTDGRWKVCDWQTAFTAIVQQLSQLTRDLGPSQIAALISPNSTTEECYLIQKVLRGLGCDHIDHRIQQVDFRDQTFRQVPPTLGIKLSDIANQKALFLVGVDVHRDQPLLGLRVRQAALNGAKILLANPIKIETHFDALANLAIAPMQLLFFLGGVVKAAHEIKANSELPAEITTFIANIQVDTEASTIAEQLLQTPTTILFGAWINNHPQAALLRSLLYYLAQLTGASIGELSVGANSAGAWLAGAIPHLGPGGFKIMTPGVSAAEFFDAPRQAYFIHGLEPELDCANPDKVFAALKQAQLTVMVTSFKNDTMLEYADVLLPLAPFTETSGTFINAQGDWQSFTAAVKPKEEARPGWKIWRVLGNMFDLPGFEYTSSQDVLAEFKATLQANPSNGSADLAQLSVLFHQPAIKAAKITADWQRITQWPLYYSDSLVRRSEPLQESAANEAIGIRINTKMAIQNNWEANQILVVQQNLGRAELPIILDDRIPDKCVLIAAGHSKTQALGDSFGVVTLCQ